MAPYHFYEIRCIRNMDLRWAGGPETCAHMEAVRLIANIARLVCIATYNGADWGGGARAPPRYSGIDRAFRKWAARD